MSDKVPISEQDVRVHLQDQVEFLKASARAFDGGALAEAKRMAVTLRILLHEGGRSSSLLRQLGSALDWDRFYSVKSPPAPPGPGVRVFGSYFGLAFMRMGGGTIRYVPHLDEPGWTTIVPFDTWWSETVFDDSRGITFSRSDLVLTVADQDGGAHVDPKVEAPYHKLTKENALGFKFEKGEESWSENPVPASVRQIAHEVLKTLEAQGFCAVEEDLRTHKPTPNVPMKSGEYRIIFGPGLQKKK